jgi:Acyl carrier protein phosphodiesterase
LGNSPKKCLKASLRKGSKDLWRKSPKPLLRKDFRLKTQQVYGIKNALERVGNRFKRKINLEEGIFDLQENYKEFERCFRIFFLIFYLMLLLQMAREFVGIQVTVSLGWKGFWV